MTDPTLQTLLANLGLWVLEQTRGDYLGSDLNGGDIQDKAEELGLLVRVEAFEPCGESCNCAEYGAFPWQCLRLHPDVRDALTTTPPPDHSPAGSRT